MYTPSSDRLALLIVSVATDRPYDQGCDFVILESLEPTSTPFLSQVTVGLGLPSTSQVRVTVFDSFVVVRLGWTSTTGGSDRKVMVSHNGCNNYEK